MKYLGRDLSVESTLSSLNLGQEAAKLTAVDPDHLNHSNPNQIVVAKSLENHEIMNLVVEKGARNVVQIPNQDFARQVSFSANVLNNPEKFFANPRLHLTQLGAKSLLNETLGVFHYPVDSQSDKDQLLDKIHIDLESVPRSSTVRNSAALVADEMLMNIIRDAPLYFSKNFPDLSPKGRQATLTIAYDHDRLLLWTEDDFGSLALDKMMARLQQCYSTEQVNPLMKTGHGAGLGCKMIFDISVSMAVLVKPGKKTVFCAVLPLGLSNRQMASLPKNLQILAMSF